MNNKTLIKYLTTMIKQLEKERLEATDKIAILKLTINQLSK